MTEEDKKEEGEMAPEENKNDDQEGEEPNDPTEGEGGADKNKANNNGTTPLIMAAQEGHLHA